MHQIRQSLDLGTSRSQNDEKQCSFLHKLPLLGYLGVAAQTLRHCLCFHSGSPASHFSPLLPLLNCCYPSKASSITTAPALSSHLPSAVLPLHPAQDPCCGSCWAGLQLQRPLLGGDLVSRDYGNKLDMHQFSRHTLASHQRWGT